MNTVNIIPAKSDSEIHEIANLAEEIWHQQLFVYSLELLQPYSIIDSVYLFYRLRT